MDFAEKIFLSVANTQVHQEISATKLAARESRAAMAPECGGTGDFVSGVLNQATLAFCVMVVRQAFLGAGKYWRKVGWGWWDMRKNSGQKNSFSGVCACGLMRW